MHTLEQWVDAHHQTLGEASAHLSIGSDEGVDVTLEITGLDGEVFGLADKRNGSCCELSGAVELGLEDVLLEQVRDLPSAQANGADDRGGCTRTKPERVNPPTRKGAHEAERIVGVRRISREVASVIIIPPQSWPTERA